MSPAQRTIRGRAALHRETGRGQLEAAFQADVIREAKARGWLYYHTHRSDRSPAGFPDLVLVRGTRLVFAELKRTGGRLSPAQREWFDALTRLFRESVVGRGTVQVEMYVWQPQDWDCVVEVLR